MELESTSGFCSSSKWFYPLCSSLPTSFHTFSAIMFPSLSPFPFCYYSYTHSLPVLNTLLNTWTSFDSIKLTLSTTTSKVDPMTVSHRCRREAQSITTRDEPPVRHLHFQPYIQQDWVAPPGVWQMLVLQCYVLTKVKKTQFPNYNFNKLLPKVTMKEKKCIVR